MEARKPLGSQFTHTRMHMLQDMQPINEKTFNSGKRRMYSDLCRLRVTTVTDPGNFTGQIGTEEILKQHDKLEEQISQFCNDIRCSEVNVDDLGDDTLVLINSQTHRKWVRAKVAQTYSDTREALVVCIDYGTSEIVSSKHIMDEVPQDFSEEVWQGLALFCRLAHIRPISSTYISRAVELFRSLVEGATVDCQVISNQHDPPPCLLDIFIQEGEEMKSISDILIEEGVAMPAGNSRPPSTLNEERKGVASFDLNLLRPKSQVSSDGDNDDAATVVSEDQEVKELRNRLEADDSVNWVSSDKTIGKDYRPNAPPNMMQNISDEVFGYYETKNAPDVSFEDEELAESSARLQDMLWDKQNKTKTHSPRKTDKQSMHLRTSSSSPRPSGHSNSPARRGRGRGTRRDPPARPTLPGGGDRSANCDGKLEKTRERDQLEEKLDRPRKLDINKKEEKNELKSKYTTQQLQNEYEWQKDQYERVIYKVLEKMKDQSILDIMMTLEGLVYPASSKFDMLPGPGELYICLRTTVRRAISVPSFVPLALQILCHFKGDEPFPTYISEILWQLQNDFVLVYAEGSAMYAENYSRFLGHLFVESCRWDSGTGDTILVCVCNTLERWADGTHKKSKSGSPSDRQVELYSRCLYMLMQVAGKDLLRHLPSEMDKLMVTFRSLVLSKTIAEEIRTMMLDLLLQISSHGQQIMVIPEEFKAEVKVTEKAIQTELLHLKDTSVQTDIQAIDFEDPPEILSEGDKSVYGEKHSEENYEQDVEEEENQVMQSDPYTRVTRMLEELGLQEKLDIFKENAIRDSTLQLEFADLKELLKECGLKAGAIYEIKSYLVNNDEDAMSSVSFRLGSKRFSKSSDNSRSANTSADLSMTKITKSMVCAPASLTPGPVKISHTLPKDKSRVQISSTGIRQKSLAELAASMNSDSSSESSFHSTTSHRENRPSIDGRVLCEDRPDLDGEENRPARIGRMISEKNRLGREGRVIGEENRNGRVIGEENRNGRVIGEENRNSRVIGEENRNGGVIGEERQHHRADIWQGYGYRQDTHSSRSDKYNGKERMQTPTSDKEECSATETADPVPRILQTMSRLEQEKFHNPESPTVLYYNAPEPPVTPYFSRQDSRGQADRSDCQQSEDTDLRQTLVFTQPMMKVTRLTGARGHPKSPSGVPFMAHGPLGSPLSSPVEKQYPKDNGIRDTKHNTISQEERNSNYNRSNVARYGNNHDSDYSSSCFNINIKNGKKDTKNTVESNKAGSNTQTRDSDSDRLNDWFSIDKKESGIQTQSKTVNSDSVEATESVQDSPSARKRCNVKSIHGIVSDWLKIDSADSHDRKNDKEVDSQPKSGKEVSKREKYTVADKLKKKKIQLKTIDRSDKSKPVQSVSSKVQESNGPKSYAGALTGAKSKQNTPERIDLDHSQQVNATSLEDPDLGEKIEKETVTDNKSWKIVNIKPNEPPPGYSLQQRCTMCGSMDHRSMHCPDRSKQFLLE